MQAKVSLCMIVRDEEAHLAACLASVRHLVDEIIVVDTGSVDSTRQIAASFGAKVHNFPWTDDFSAARNESRRLATGKWILWLDADDRIDPANQLRLAGLISRLDTVERGPNPIILLNCASTLPGSASGFSISQGRMFQNHSDVRWTGRIHERFVTAGNADPENLTYADITIQHVGYENEAHWAHKQRRDLRLLEMEYEGNPDDPMTLFYLGRLRLWLGETAEALRVLARCCEQDPAGTRTATSMAYGLLISCLIKLGRRDDALRMNGEALSRFENDVALWYQRGCMLDEARRPAEAEACFRRLLAAPKPKIAPAGVRPGLQAENARLMLARICHEQGRFAEAEAEYRLVVQAQPNCAEAWFLFGQLLISQRRQGEADEAIGRLEACPDAVFQHALLNGRSMLEQNRFAECRRSVNRAIANRPGDVYPYILLSEALFREGKDWERCLEVHQKTLAMDPRQDAVRERMQRLLAMRPERPVPAASTLAPSGAVPCNLSMASGLQGASHLSFAC